MKKKYWLLLPFSSQFALSILVILSLVCFQKNAQSEVDLISLYAKQKSLWPSAETIGQVKPGELALLPQKNEINSKLSALGKQLFHDTNLSKNRTVSCASCHEERLTFSDARKTAIGIHGQVGRRNTPAIFAVDLWQSFFWDGRAKTAAEQALLPIQDAKEMNLTLIEAKQRLSNSADYTQQFESLFKDGITSVNIGEAIAEFERTIIPVETKFDHFLSLHNQNPEKAVQRLSKEELKGLHLFRTKAKCMTCHNGSLMSDNQFHVTGLHFFGRKHQDLGRYNFTANPADSGKFRTPSLRYLSKTSPWMHNGLFGSLDGIINFYNSGGARPKPGKKFKDDPLFPKTSDLLEKLSLTKEEKKSLKAFLEIL